MKAIFTPHSPENCSTIRPFQNTTTWGPHEKKNEADSRAPSKIIILSKKRIPQSVLVQTPQTHPT